MGEFASERHSRVTTCPVLLCTDRLVGFSTGQCPEKQESCCCIRKVKQARLSDSYSSPKLQFLKLSLLLFLANELPIFNKKKKMACPLELTLVINLLSLPGLFREGKSKCIFNTTVILLDAFCGDKGPHNTYREACWSFSLLENSGENHIILFSNASHYYFNFLYDDPVFSNSTHPNMDFF